MHLYKKSESKPERDTKQLKTNAFVPFFNTLFETSVIYILWLLVRFGQKAGNYELVIAAARHYWNAIKPFIVEPIERELLREPMEAVLECIAAVAANEVGKEDEVRRSVYKTKTNMCTLINHRLPFCQCIPLKQSYDILIFPSFPRGGLSAM